MLLAYRVLLHERDRRRANSTFIYDCDKQTLTQKLTPKPSVPHYGVVAPTGEANHLTGMHKTVPSINE